MKLKVFILTFITVLMFSSSVFASDVVVSINNQLIEDKNIVIEKSGTVYISLGEIAERKGLETYWLAAAQLAVIKSDDNYLGFWMASDIALNNNVYENMGNSSITIDGRIYVPMNFLFEQLNIAYEWDAELLHANIVDETLIVNQDEVKVLNYTDEDLLWLARIVDFEARGGSVEKKIAVANVVLNRVNSPSFPDNIYGVLFQKGQFPPAYYSSFNSTVPVATSYTAAKRALMGAVNAEDCLYFNNRPFNSKVNDFYKNIEGDYFYY